MTATARIQDFKSHVGATVKVSGWIHNKRSSGKLQFLILRDGTGYAQAVVSKAAVSEDAWPDELEVAARAADDRVVMALRHRAWPVHGVQFHPESVLTGEGRHLLRNFLTAGRSGR